MFAWPQFGLRDLLLFTVASAVAVAALVNDWAHGLLVGVTGAIVVGLLIQAYDLAWAFRGQKELTPDERHGWQFAVFWRSAVFVVFVLQVGLDFLAPRTEFDQYSPGVLQAYVYYLLALVGLLSAANGSSRQVIKGYWRWLVNGVRWCFALWVAAQILRSAAVTMILNHRTVMGFVWSIPGLRREEWSTAALRIEGDHYYAVAQAGALMTLIALVQIAALAGLWRRPYWRLALLIVVLGSVAGSIAITVWLSTTGLAAASPFFIEVRIFPRWQESCMVAAMLLMVTTVVASRIVSPLESVPNDIGHWRRHANAYLHEWRTISFLLAVTVIAHLAKWFPDETALWRTIGQEPHWYQSPLWWNRIYASFVPHVIQPESLLSIAVFMAAIRCTFSRRRQCFGAGNGGPRTLLLARFLCVWLLTLTLLFSAAITCRWLAFGMWLSE